MGAMYGQTGAVWAGEFLEPRDVLVAFALQEFPATSPYRTATPSPAPVATPVRYVAPGLKLEGFLRVFGVLGAVFGTFAVIGTCAYVYERYTTALASHWIACPATNPERIPIPPDTARIEMDPHLPQGAVNYEIRVLDANGRAVATYKSFLDMSPKRRTLKVPATAESASLDVGCSLSVPVAGFRSWPVEIRFARELRAFGIPIPISGK